MKINICICNIYTRKVSIIVKSCWPPSISSGNIMIRVVVPDFARQERVLYQERSKSCTGFRSMKSLVAHSGSHSTHTIHAMVSTPRSLQSHTLVPTPRSLQSHELVPAPSTGSCSIQSLVTSTGSRSTQSLVTSTGSHSMQSLVARTGSHAHYSSTDSLSTSLQLHTLIPSPSNLQSDALIPAPFSLYLHTGSSCSLQSHALIPAPRSLLSRTGSRSMLSLVSGTGSLSMQSLVAHQFQNHSLQSCTSSRSIVFIHALVPTPCSLYSCIGSPRVSSQHQFPLHLLSSHALISDPCSLLLVKNHSRYMLTVCSKYSSSKTNLLK